MNIVYLDESVIVCVKPPRVLSTDEPGGLPELLRRELGTEDVRTVHRLDRVVSGLMVLARNGDSAAELSGQIRQGSFEKSYLAVVHGDLMPEEGTMRDLLLRDKQERKTYVVTEPAKGVQEAILNYLVTDNRAGMSKVSICLVTGRTHQIRAQFSSRGYPLVGDRKYSTNDDGCEIALWSNKLAFDHPVTGERMAFAVDPPKEFPWDLF